MLYSKTCKIDNIIYYVKSKLLIKSLIWTSICHLENVADEESDEKEEMKWVYNIVIVELSHSSCRYLLYLHNVQCRYLLYCIM